MKNQKLFVSLVLIFSIFYNTGCAHKHLSKDIAILPDQGPIRIELKPQVGYKDITDYKSRTVTKTFEKGEITKKISEAVDYAVEMTVTRVDSKRQVGTYQLTTLEKQGKMDLADFAMPEFGESLEYVLSSQGQVVRAGDKPPGSIYFVPPVSFPKEEVRVGDSWPLVAEWISSKSGVPLRMEMVSILKNVRNCGSSGSCAEIEVSGDVALLGAKGSNISPTPIDGKQLKMRFHSEIKGRLLISVANGTVLYSVVKSDEYLNGVTDSLQISSCMVSFVRSPVSENIVQNKSPDCDPLAELPSI